MTVPLVAHFCLSNSFFALKHALLHENSKTEAEDGSIFGEYVKDIETQGITITAIPQEAETEVELETFAEPEAPLTGAETEAEQEISTGPEAEQKILTEAEVEQAIPGRGRDGHGSPNAGRDCHRRSSNAPPPKQRIPPSRHSAGRGGRGGYPWYPGYQLYLKQRPRPLKRQWRPKATSRVEKLVSPRSCSHYAAVRMRRPGTISPLNG